MLTQHRALTKMIRSATSTVPPVTMDLVVEVVVEQPDPLGLPMPLLVLHVTNRGQVSSGVHLHVACPPPLLPPVRRLLRSLSL